MHWSEVKRQVENEFDRLINKVYYTNHRGLVNLKGWKLVWDKRPEKRAGQCRHRLKEIGISIKVAKARNIKGTINTVRHEIAHAVAGSGHGHNQIWRDMCKLTGAKQERCYNFNEVDENKLSYKARTPKYTATCKNCERKYNFGRKGKYWRGAIEKSRGGDPSMWKVCHCGGTIFSFVQNY